MDNSKTKDIFYHICIAILVLLIVIIMFFLIFKMIKKNTKIELLSDVIILKVGEIKQIPYTVNNEDTNIIFESTNSSVATIDNQGYIYGIKVGEVFVTAKIENDDKVRKCKVEVVEEYTDGSGTKKDEGSDEEKERKTNVTPKPNTTIVNPKPTCTINVSSDGLISVKVNNAAKYSFDKNNLDSNESQKHIKDIKDKEVRDYEGWKYYRVNYYVENADGVKGNCSIIVIEKCNNGVCTYEKN